MSRPEAIAVDAATGLVRWRDGEAVREAHVPGARDVRYDPASDRLLVLAQDGETGTIALLSRDGALLESIAPPPGYSISHFSGNGPEIVCQGATPDGDWWDWHFEFDGQTATLRKRGPAY